MIGSILDFQLLTIGGTPITVSTAIAALIILLLSRLVSHLLQRALGRTLGRRGLGDEGSRAVAKRLLNYTIMLVGTAVALDTLGINLGALFAAGAIVAVGLGFAMQNIAQNFVSGVILLIERSIKPGDILEAEGKVVRVMKMGIRATLARTRDDEELIIPNSILVQSTVKNFTLQDSLYRVRAKVGVIYGSDLRVVFDALRSVAASIDWRNKDKEPRVQLDGFGSSSVDFDVSVWIDDPWEYPPRLSQLYEALWWALKEADVVIAFPQLDVHFDRPVTDSLRSLATVN